MNRRTFLAAGTTSLAALAGCTGLLGSSSSATVNHPGNLETSFNANMELPTDETPGDGVPPEYAGGTDERSVDESQFSALSTNGETVTLVPVEVARYWHRRREARFVDARGLAQYKRAHIFGAVNSPAVRGSQGGAIGGWPTDDRVVCYCRCPHHLSSVRAAGLQKSGFSTVYAIDEGFGAWYDNDDPMRGTDFSNPQEAVVAGEVAASYAGENVWAVHEASGQREAAPVADDGSFELHLRFYDVTADSQIRVSTPTFDVTRPLGELTSGVLTE
jgi:rhodanese-related sulfurtransferase